jgi:hypothetical protein
MDCLDFFPATRNLFFGAYLAQNEISHFIQSQVVLVKIVPQIKRALCAVPQSAARF